MAADVLPLPASYRPLLCPICKCLLHDPITLPCGFSLCSDCLPTPKQVDFQNQIHCPFPPCARSKVHAVQALRVDVTLQKLTQYLRESIALRRNRILCQQDVDRRTTSDVPDHSQNPSNPSFTSTHHGHTNRSPSSSAQQVILKEDIENAREHHQPEHLYYGDDAAASSTGWPATLEGLFDPYDPSDNGKFDKPEIIPRAHIPTLQDLDPAILLKMSQEVECQICFMPFCSPITTSCGHSLCKACLIRALDNTGASSSTSSPNCPLCRTTLPMYPYFYNQPSNKALTQFIQYLNLPLPPGVDRKSIEQENTLDPPLAALPLFVSALVYPNMPCYLHIFEPRYRRLLRNVLKTESKVFGMVLPPRHARKRVGGVVLDNHGLHPATDLHTTPWEPSMSHGVLLKILSFEPLMDGRALVETVATDRFQILTYSMLDGYHTATAIEFVHDIPEVQESGLERQAILEAARKYASRAAEPGDVAESNEEAGEVDLILGRIAGGVVRPQQPSSSSPHSSPSHQGWLLSEKAGDLDTDEAAATASSSSSPSPSNDHATVTTSTATNRPSGEYASSSPSPPTQSRRLRDMDFDTMTRKQLLEILVAFVHRMQEQLGPLAMARLEREHGELVLVGEDCGAQLTFWVARALPLPTYELYELLKVVSARERLLKVVQWLRELEIQRSSTVCTIQ